MSIYRLASTAIFGLAAFVFLFDCRAAEPTVPPSVGSQTAVPFGPLVELLKVQTVRDKVTVIAGKSGEVHIFIASTNLKKVIEVTVRENDVVEQRTVQSDISPEMMDAAFDEKGKLHLLIDTQLFIFENGAWRISEETPWKEAGVKPLKARFVPGSKDLIWAFQVAGSETGAPKRLEIYGFGGGPAAIIWPWFTTGSRTVLVANGKSGYGPWVAVEPEGKLDSDVVGVGADRSGNVYLLYSLSQGGIAERPSYRYAKIAAELFKPVRGNAAAGMDEKPEARKAFAIEGRPLPLGGAHQWLSVDPNSGKAFVSLRFIVIDNTWSDQISWPLDGVKLWNVRVAADLDDAFSALTIGPASRSSPGKGNVVRYMRLSGGTWSAPVEIGEASVGSFFGLTGEALGIARAIDGRVFAVWPTEGAIVGRWIQPDR
jgi:hypothetical protein